MWIACFCQTFSSFKTIIWSFKHNLFETRLQIRLNTFVLDKTRRYKQKRPSHAEIMFSMLILRYERLRHAVSHTWISQCSIECWNFWGSSIQSKMIWNYTCGVPGFAWGAMNRFLSRKSTIPLVVLHYINTSIWLTSFESFNVNICNGHRFCLSNHATV